MSPQEQATADFICKVDMEGLAYAIIEYHDAGVEAFSAYPELRKAWIDGRIFEVESGIDRIREELGLDYC